MQRVPKEYRRDKTLGVAINEMEIFQLTELAKWYFQWGTDDKKKSRKGACLLARKFIENGMKKMLSEMQLENSPTITTGA